MGKKVDWGECWDFVKLVFDQVYVCWDGLYIFGKLFDFCKDCLQFGDIIQFENVKIYVKVVNGYYEELFFYYIVIICCVFGLGKVELIYQNFGSIGCKVGMLELDFLIIMKGKMIVYCLVFGD